MSNLDSKYHVLIVDDVPENLQVISNILYQKGVNISVAQNGRDALTVVSRKPPDLIVLDITMPEMDGFEVCEHVKKNPETRDIPIIFLTARTQSDDIVKGFELGAVDYVTKPFHPPELLARVFTHLELKKSRDIIMAQNKELHELNATKDKFFSIIAHDLRNPFCQIMTLSDLLKNEWQNYPADHIEKWVQSMYQASERGYNLLANLLEWAHSQTGRMQFQPQQVHLNTLVTESIEFLESSANNKQIILHAEIPENLCAFVDKNMLKTVIRNLVSNAIKYTETGGEVKIEAKNSGEWIEIAISDTGVGIKEQYLKNLFRIDIHYSTVGTAQEKGTGLGLILCKEFVEKHGGTIRVESEMETGSTFTFTVPHYTEERCLMNTSTAA
jgi:two-component system sensor histidine kinase/response regulator